MLATPVSSVSVGAPVSGGGTSEVLFVGAGGTLSQDPNFVWDAANHRLGIGATPLAQLHVQTFSAAGKGLIVQGSPSQTASLQEWQNSAGQVVGSLSNNGDTIFNLQVPGQTYPFFIDVSAGMVEIGTANAISIIFVTSNTSRWTILSTGPFGPYIDASLDIGQPAANRPRNVYVAQSVIAGGFANAQRVVTAASAFTSSDGTILANAAGGAFPVTLPAANSVPAGRRFSVKKIDAGANAVTLTAAGTDKIDNGATFALAAANKYVTVECDGVANWWIIANN